MANFYYQRVFEFSLEELVFDEFYGHLSPERQQILDNELATNPAAVKRKEEMIFAFSDPAHVAMMADAKKTLDASCSTVEKLMKSIKRKNWKKRMRRDYYFYEDSRFSHLFFKHERREIRELKAIEEGRMTATTPVLLLDLWNDSPDEISEPGT